MGNVSGYGCSVGGGRGLYRAWYARFGLGIEGTHTHVGRFPRWGFVCLLAHGWPVAAGVDTVAARVFLLSEPRVFRGGRGEWPWHGVGMNEASVLAARACSCRAVCAVQVAKPVVDR